LPRLFVAVDIPEPIKTDLAALASTVAGARCVGAAEIHLTLRFIGEIDPHTFAAIKNALSEIGFPQFPLSLRGVGHFPPHGHPRVLWVGLDAGRELTLLQQEIESALKRSGIPGEERRFSPHITLARFKEPSSAAVARFEASYRELAFPPFEVNEFILYSSVLSPRGAVHSKEAVYSCSGTASL